MGTAITRPECDSCLKDLALLLPRANLAPADVDRMLDLYFGLLHEARMTRAILVSACKRYVTAPKKGKQRWFPDPGELIEIVQDEINERKQRIQAIQRGLDVLAGRMPAEKEPEVKYVTRDSMRSVADILAARPRPDAVRAPVIQRPEDAQAVAERLNPTARVQP